MIDVEVARFAQIEPTPWKNGLGRTTQLAIHPRDATNETFAWRVSIARLDVSAPFSKFDGVNRCLAVLQGELLLRGLREPAYLTPHSQPCHFSGSEIVEGQVIRGPVLDLNVMYRSADWQASVRRVSWSTLSMSATQLLCTLSDSVAVQIAGEDLQLSRFDLLRANAPAELRVTGNDSLDAYLIDFIPVATG